ncbi:MAG: hypothetical protein EA428_10540 [Spirochaetaceae bacterium]|nr:MAG: hypothetical protein EA428_10540 [Spirochaetaceae bacterium]
MSKQGNSPKLPHGSGIIRVLAIDLGGTNASFAIVETAGAKQAILSRLVLSSGQQKSFAAALRTALRHFDNEPELMASVKACCVSAAGPVAAGVCTPTNLPYTVSTHEVENILKVPCSIMNDFEAICYGVPLLDLNDAQQVCRIHLTQERQDNSDGEYGVAAVIGAGTGLGMGYLSWVPPDLKVFASEGGHLDFAPWDEQSSELASYLQHELGRFPDREHALSGPSIPRIYRFMTSSGRAPTNELSLRIGKLAHNEQPEAIAAASVGDAADPGCKATMSMFFALYGRQCGAAALQFLPSYGVFLAGGIASKNAPALMSSPEFVEAYLAGYSGNLRRELLATPLYIILDYQISLLGAAHAARQRLTDPAA